MGSIDLAITAAEKKLGRVVARSRACRTLCASTSPSTVLALLGAFEAEAVGGRVASPKKLAMAVEAACWRSLLLRRYGRVTRERVRAGGCDAWVRGWLASRWPRLSRLVAVEVRRRVAVRVLVAGEGGLPRGVLRLRREFSALRALEAAVGDGGVLAVNRASGRGGAAGSLRGSAPVVVASAQRGLGLCGCAGLAALVEARGCSVIAVPDADRLGREAAAGVADLLAVGGLGVALGVGLDEAPGLWRPGSKRLAEERLLDGLCVGPVDRVGAGLRCGPAGSASRLAPLPDGVIPWAFAVGGPDRPLALLAALCARLLPGRVVALRAGTGEPAALVRKRHRVPASLDGFAALGADVAALGRARAAARRAASSDARRAAAEVRAASSRAPPR